MGAYTLDIYLIQMILVERILGPFYRSWKNAVEIDCLHMFGIQFEIVATFVLSFVLLEFISWISQFLNKMPLYNGTRNSDQVLGF